MDKNRSLRICNRYGLGGVLVCLLSLGTAITAQAGECGDVSGAGGITASDALLLLKKAVGQAGPPLVCPILATGQTTSYGTGDDGDVQAGAALSYVDNGDGTITDANTGLMWEKKVALDNSSVLCTTELDSCANPHDADNAYSWSVSEPTYNGGVVTIFLAQLNDRCDQDATVSCTTDGDCTAPGGACGFAGYRDWRLPTIKELQSMVDYSVPAPGPVVDAAFRGGSCGASCTDITVPACSCTYSADYWSSTTTTASPAHVWNVYFNYGSVGEDGKEAEGYARAVRGGL